MDLKKENMRLTIEQLEKGRMRFLADFRDVDARINSLTQAIADAIGISLDTYRENETMRELREIARVRNLDSTEFFWRYVADTDAEYAEMIKGRDAAVTRALGL